MSVRYFKRLHDWARYIKYNKKTGQTYAWPAYDLTVNHR
nr:MAG TPA: hypothetical protein [Caudoviricetes sp.]